MHKTTNIYQKGYTKLQISNGKENTKPQISNGKKYTKPQISNGKKYTKPQISNEKGSQNHKYLPERVNKTTNI